MVPFDALRSVGGPQGSWRVDAWRVRRGRLGATEIQTERLFGRCIQVTMKPAGITQNKPNTAYETVWIKMGAPGNLALAITMAVIA